jgi:hypothetical protein
MKHLSSFMRGCSVALLMLLWLAGPAARAQAPAWQSAVLVGSPLYYGVTAMTTDASGNVLLAGTFSGTLLLGGFSLVSAGGDDVFIAKWSPASNTYAWAQRLGGTGDEANPSLVVSGASVYVSG